MNSKLRNAGYILTIIIFIVGCKKKQNESESTRIKKQKKRVIYLWHKVNNRSCFLLQGKRKCWFVKLTKLTRNAYSIRIQPDPFQDTPLLRFRLKNLSVGDKKAPETDVSYVKENKQMYTNYDYGSATILKITQNTGKNISGTFNFRIRNIKKEWIYVTQGYFKVNIN